MAECSLDIIRTQYVVRLMAFLLGASHALHVQVLRTLWLVQSFILSHIQPSRIYSHSILHTFSTVERQLNTNCHFNFHKRAIQTPK